MFAPVEPGTLSGQRYSSASKDARLLWIFPVVLFAVEYTALSLFPHRWFTIHLYRGAPVVFGLALLFFGRSQFRVFAQGQLAFKRGIATVHVASLAFLIVFQATLLRYPSPSERSKPPLLVLIWLVLLLTTIGTLLASFVSFGKLVAIARELGSAWAYAAVSSILVVFLRQRLQFSWDTSSHLLGRILQQAAFGEARALLRLFYPVVISDPVTHILGTDRFLVSVAGVCSGIEGLALISVFMLVWFIAARHELHLWRATLLVPVALLLMWLLNLLRLVALIAIGTAGHPDIAINGFHSQAGWICFNLVALGFLAFAQRSPWLHREFIPAAGASLAQTRPLAPSRNVAAIYLAPFLAITGASLLSQAASSGFERFYPLRLFAALAVLWYFRKEYSALNWRCGWLGPVVGFVVAAVWLGLHFAQPGSGAGNVGAGLATLSPLERLLWITLRLAAATLTVPIAEELAFRGFLVRRLMQADVEAVPYSQIGTVALLLSSFAFGLMHGRMWLVGTLTGIVFALVAKRRDRLGEAIGAHIVANSVIAAAVLWTGNYSLWS